MTWRTAGGFDFPASWRVLQNWFHNGYYPTGRVDFFPRACDPFPYVWPLKKRDSAPELHDTDEPDPEDLERATWIQQKAQIGAMFANRLDDPTEDQAKQRQHYENVRDELLGVFDGIEDEYCRGFASHQLIKMCLPAKDVAVCRALLAGVRDKFLRERILEDFPVLAPDGRDWRTGK